MLLCVYRLNQVREAAIFTGVSKNSNRYSQSFVYCPVFVLVIINYSTKKGVLVNSRKSANEIVYFRSNPYRKQILLYYNFHVSLGDKTEKRCFALGSPGFESHTDIISLFCVSFLCCFYYYCEATDTADENLDL